MMSARTNRPVTALAALVSGLIGLGACSSNNSTDPQIPLVSFSSPPINLTNQQYTNLRFDNGCLYVPGGVSGLIVVRQNVSTYLAFERACPYQGRGDCALVSIDPSRLFLRDSCCTSQFSLQGQIQGGPTRLPLRQYNAALSGNILTISN